MTLPDHDRPLNKRGKRDAPLMGKWLRSHDLIPDVIISSTARRAHDTAEAVAVELDYPKPVTTTRDFYHAYPDEYVQKLQQLSPDVSTAMVVGHNPGMEELVSQLTGAYEAVQTATVAYVELPIDDWQALDETTRGKLMAIWRPKEIALT